MNKVCLLAIGDDRENSNSSSSQRPEDFDSEEEDEDEFEGEEGGRGGGVEKGENNVDSVAPSAHRSS